MWHDQVGITKNQVTEMIKAYFKMHLGFLPTRHLSPEVKATPEGVGPSKAGSHRGDRNRAQQPRRHGNQQERAALDNSGMI